jgi:lipoprotein-anchoring transpeptidase ErfK/SrfK
MTFRPLVTLLLFFVGPLLSHAPAAEPAPAASEEPRPVESWLEAQVELHRRGFSCGSIDGVFGPQTQAALQAFQRREGLRESGQLDDATKEHLTISTPALTEHTFEVDELGALHPLPPTWLEKSEQESLPHATPLERAAELHRASPAFLKKLNPDFDWDGVLPGKTITVPAIITANVNGTAARVIIRLAAHELEVLDANDQILARFPVSIARKVDKRPIGDLRVTVVIPDPNYTFDPAVFPESPEAVSLGRKLIIPPGPNNPVGVAWIGLDRPGYGIHGTPDPEHVGRTESHGCFRLANWDAITLLKLVRSGTPVAVEP